MNWFKVETRPIDGKPYYFVGCSNESLESLAKKVEAGQCIKLEQLLYMDHRGDVQDWATWDKSLIPTIVLHSKGVLSIMQFKGDPRAIPK